MVIFNKSRRRAIVPLVLGLWIFALATSMAHAYGVLNQLGDAGVANPLSAGVAHQEPGHEALAACDQFCADDIPLPSKPKSVEDSRAASAVLIVAPDPRVYLPASPRSSSAVAGQDPPPAIAVITRFVRLLL